MAPFLQYAYSSFGAYLAYHQEELNDFTKYLIDHQSELGIDYDSKEFQDGVYVQLDAYFKLRIQDKKLVAQEIFTSFCGSPNKPEFPLERYNDTLTKISVEGLKYLIFLQNEIYPLRDADIERKYDGGNYPEPPVGKPKAWWVENFKKTDPLSPYITTWVNNTYAPNIDVSKVEMGKEDYRQEELQRKNDDLADLFLEMEQLGIMRTYNVGTTWDAGGSSAYSLTPYGIKFMEFIPSPTE